MANDDMNLANDQLVFAEDLVIIPVRELSSDLRHSLDCHPDDFTVSRRHSRQRTVVIDPEAVGFLSCFREPASLVEAVVAYSRVTGKDSRQLLEDAYPLIHRLRTAQLLVVPNSESGKTTRPVLQVNDVFRSFEVLECIQALDDVDVYRVQNREIRGALKLARSGNSSWSRRLIEHETAILITLDGSPSPRLLASGTEDDRSFLVTEWLDGPTLLQAANQIRNEKGTDTLDRILRLCICVAGAYADLHEKGILHGDVHPRNIVATPDRVRLLDFGLSLTFSESAGHTETPRGGIAYFFEPEYALATLNRTGKRSATLAGEQYGLAALFFLVFTGKHYLDFRVEKETMLRQILTDQPVSFDRRGVPSQPEIEAVLLRALSKEPKERFPSLRAMTQALNAASVLPPRAKRDFKSEASTPAMPRPTSAPNSLLHQALERWGPGGSEFLRPELPAPFSSVNYGAAGIALAFYRMSVLQDNPEFLSTADIWIQRAARQAALPQAFENHELGLTRAVIGEVSLFHSKTGIFCMQALIAHALGDWDGLERAIADYLRCANVACTDDDPVLGRGSLLLGYAAILEVLRAPSCVQSRLRVKERGLTLLEEILARLQSFGPIASCRQLATLPVAHGWAGIIHAAMRFQSAAGLPANTQLYDWLDQLRSLGRKTEFGVSWPRQLTDKPGATGDLQSSWCNGTSGFVHLYTQAYRSYGDIAFLQSAIDAGRETFANPGTHFSLCCGLPGNAYALLNLYRQTREQEWLVRARELAARSESLAAPALSSPFAHSLYKGALGTALLVADAEEPDRSSMPLFDTIL